MPGEDGIQHAISVFGDQAKILYPSEGNVDLMSADRELNALVEIISRHPVSEKELNAMLVDKRAPKSRRKLSGLERKGLIQKVERNGMIFWVAGGAHFPKH